MINLIFSTRGDNVNLTSFFMDLLLYLLSSTNWAFVAVCVVMSLVFGSIWFHPKVLGTKYARWMKLPTPAGKMPEGMWTTFVFEIISRILYFTGLAQALYISGWENLGSGLAFAFIVWLIFVFSTQMSLIAWTNADKKVLILTSTNVLIQTLIATVLWYTLFV